MVARRRARSIEEGIGERGADIVRGIAASGREGVCWSASSSDLDVNLVAWSPSHGVGLHENDAVDVLFVGVRGTGVVEIDGRPFELRPGRALILPRGARRSVRASTRFLYLTCHRRRAGTFTAEELLGRRRRKERSTRSGTPRGARRAE